MPKKILVTGSRNWTDRRQIIARLLQEPDDTTIIAGGSGHVDNTAAFLGRALGWPVIVLKAEWSLYGRGAGHIRNGRMLALEPDLVLAFRLNQSPGTTDCINQAMKLGIQVEIVDVEIRNPAS